MKYLMKLISKNILIIQLHLFPLCFIFAYTYIHYLRQVNIFYGRRNFFHFRGLLCVDAEVLLLSENN